MSNYKNWKNKELGQNLAEHFGFKFRLDEGFGEGKPAKDEWSKKQEIEESEEEIDEVHYGGKQKPHRPGTPRGPDKCYDEEGTEIPCAELNEEEQELEETGLPGKQIKTGSPKGHTPKKCYDDKGNRIDCIEEEADLEEGGAAARGKKGKGHDTGKDRLEADRAHGTTENKKRVTEDALKNMVRKHVKLALEEIKNESKA